ncbi:hypothetical protein [Pseudoalteromonas luteoviolacea]|uniref:Uncharacterized protein n=1 Tax=Pseudoalteromonas luteoviolacea DSM 6061 TaxID=1365250 RepID=A0A166YIV1_9GAMM|nr:hypothetical protein [Pseudoalteromonas luteoviolacea]KZN42672.1 hypothetical protein N475_10095 [Pseudoalteromonas luteoviolacea DSM 6061]KZN59930.1 hypothetical protein N474_05930 [Pseudoalteromonas luteoviolacea CPMOR-2]TQF69791.1 hypothetical protein FLM44_01445 [Pseudoalteromonas luteoviolacea]
MKLLLKKNKLKNLSNSYALKNMHTPKIAGGFDLTVGENCRSRKCRISEEVCPISEVGDCHTQDINCLVTRLTCKC